MTADQTVRRVVVAGGGTAGWIAAAALARQLGPLLEITLVESDAIGTVGVGEATIPTHRTFHHLMGIDERDFMRATKATFKLGIAFENWARRGDRYIHSFGQIGKPTWMGEFYNVWLGARAEGEGGELGEYCFELQAAEAGKFATSDKARINYAYHLDASLYAAYLRKLAEAQGVTRIEGRIDTVEQDGETGDITALVLEDGQRIAGDLFIDCTGFRGLLIEQTLKSGFEDWHHWLPMDRALAVQTTSVGPALPYTRSIAHGAGWQWRIPLQHRIGNGLVYCSDHCSDDEARDALLANLEGEYVTEPRVIRFRTGRRQQVWKRNCIALGLASGFVEPLESTSIHLIQIGITRLIQLFPFGGANPSIARHFNELSRNELERIRDFIVLHYKLTERDDTAFWRQCRSMDIPDSLAQRIALFRENGLAYQAGDDLFRVDSWLQVMLGQRLEPKSHHRFGALMTADQRRQVFEGIRTNIARAVAGMPSHQDFVDDYCAAEPV
ncbi:tryptophan halogenase family protein [Maricaulis sp.]|uniref:tryptophan halogenase family protein n=1 Tax=Maricaulis sp. TaxID=1486257 RepID=UPI00262A40C2|nr:tryptophan halogenase family protein [Maricaulis sp.]